MGRVESSEGNVFRQVPSKGQAAPRDPCLTRPEQNKASNRSQNVFRKVTSDVPSVRETQNEEAPDNFKKKVIPMLVLESDPSWKYRLCLRMSPWTTSLHLWGSIPSPKKMAGLLVPTSRGCREQESGDACQVPACSLGSAQARWPRASRKGMIVEWVREGVESRGHGNRTAGMGRGQDTSEKTFSYCSIMFHHNNQLQLGYKSLNKIH